MKGELKIVKYTSCTLERIPHLTWRGPMSKADFTTATEIMWPGHVPYEGFAREEVTCQHDGAGMP